MTLGENCASSFEFSDNPLFEMVQYRHKSAEVTESEYIQAIKKCQEGNKQLKVTVVIITLRGKERFVHSEQRLPEAGFSLVSYFVEENQKATQVKREQFEQRLVQEQMSKWEQSTTSNFISTRHWLNKQALGITFSKEGYTSELTVAMFVEVQFNIQKDCTMIVGAQQAKADSVKYLVLGQPTTKQTFIAKVDECAKADTSYRAFAVHDSLRGEKRFIAWERRRVGSNYQPYVFELEREQRTKSVTEQEFYL